MCNTEIDEGSFAEDFTLINFYLFIQPSMLIRPLIGVTKAFNVNKATIGVTQAIAQAYDVKKLYFCVNLQLHGLIENFEITV